MFQVLSVTDLQSRYPSQYAKLVSDMKALYVATVVSGTYDDPDQTQAVSQRVADFYDGALFGQQPSADVDYLVQFVEYSVDEHGIKALMSQTWLSAWFNNANHGYWYTWCFDLPQSGWCWRLP